MKASIPIVSGERPSMVKDDRLTDAPILVIDLCSVFGCDERHGSRPVGCLGFWDAAPAFERAAKMGELTVDATRTPAVPAIMSRRDTAVRDAFDVSFMFMLQVVHDVDSRAD
jgi:hypothetical protein